MKEPRPATTGRGSFTFAAGHDSATTVQFWAGLADTSGARCQLPRPSVVAVSRRPDERCFADMIMCAPVTKEGMIDPRWGRADWVAVADVVGGGIVSWQEVEVSWSRLHDEGAPGSHHARVVTFLREHQVEAVVANHIGPGMVRMLDTMGLPVFLGAAGDARAAVQAASGGS